MIDNLLTKERVFGTLAWMGLHTGSFFAHEYSHMIAIRTLFTNIDPYMDCDSFFPFIHCYVDWNGNPAIRPELSITSETGHGIVSAAGPISDITLSALSAVAACKIRNSNKKIALLFAAHAFSRSLNIFLYAISTQRSGMNDFASVESQLGIPHYIQTAITGSVALGAALLMKNIFFSNSTEVNGKKNS